MKIKPETPAKRPQPVRTTVCLGVDRVLVSVLRGAVAAAAVQWCGDSCRQSSADRRPGWSAAPSLTGGPGLTPRDGCSLAAAAVSRHAPHITHCRFTRPNREDRIGLRRDLSERDDHHAGQ